MTTNNTLKKQLNNLSTKPGVYLFKNSAGEVIYVGKAKNLKNRVRSYFQESQNLPIRTAVLIQQISRIEFTVVSSEIESLILENIYIKKYKPRFNILLRDDKNYQFIKLDYDQEIPQIYPVRKISLPNQKPASYFGPYTSGLAVKNTLHLIKRVFRLCQNKKITAKPCFAYHLGRCPGICFGKISRAEYLAGFTEINKFLRHEHKQILVEQEKNMKRAAAQKHFEKAARLRDRLLALRHLWEKQKIISPQDFNHDYLGLFLAKTQAYISILKVRHGRLLGQENFILDHHEQNASEILNRFAMQYYQETSDLPKKIFVPVPSGHLPHLQAALQKLRQSRILIQKPARGRHAQLLKLASENAEQYSRQQLASFEKDQNAVLAALQKLLSLPRLPSRIEGFDISNLQGTNPVGSMVVFENGKPAKSRYRKFKIQNKTTPDDYAMMKEMLTRRFVHSQIGSKSQIQNTKSQKNSKQQWPLPDLVIIDGGKGQLNVALTALRISNFQFPISKQIPLIGLSKRLEEIFIPGQKAGIILPGNSPILHLLQRIRDESHRFAISFYRGRHRYELSRSRLDDIPGIGPATRKKLLKAFGSLSAIRQAPFSALEKVVGGEKAQKIQESL